MSHQPPPLGIPSELEPKGFFSELTTSLYFIWEGINKKVGFYGQTGINQGASLTASDTNSPNTGDAITDAIIENLQTRVDELEARLNSSTGVGLIT